MTPQRSYFPPWVFWIGGTAAGLVLMWLFGTLPPNDSSDWPWFGGIVAVVFLWFFFWFHGQDGRMAEDEAEDRKASKLAMVLSGLVGIPLLLAGIAAGLGLIGLGVVTAFSDDPLPAIYYCGGGFMLLGGIASLFSD